MDSEVQVLRYMNNLKMLRIFKIEDYMGYNTSRIIPIIKHMNSATAALIGLELAQRG